MYAGQCSACIQKKNRFAYYYVVIGLVVVFLHSRYQFAVYTFMQMQPHFPCLIWNLVTVIDNRLDNIRLVSFVDFFGWRRRILVSCKFFYVSFF